MNFLTRRATWETLPRCAGDKWLGMLQNGS